MAPATENGCARRWTSIAAAAIAVALLGPTRGGARRVPVVPPAVALPSDVASSRALTRELEARVRRDPEDFVAQNKLAGQYLQGLRESGEGLYATLARRAAAASLRVLPADTNPGALALLIQAEAAGHDFGRARDHARQLTVIEPAKAYSYQMLGDALLELGKYEQAGQAYRRMRHLGGIDPLTRVASEQRLSRWAWLHGRVGRAEKSMVAALETARTLATPPRETVAWCYWQLGELAFNAGDYATAEARYDDALTTFPDYFRAVASLGRVRASRGDAADAVARYQEVVQVIPGPALFAAVGDVYASAGQPSAAVREYAVVKQIVRAQARDVTFHPREVALFYADHDVRPATALALARREYARRRDVYGADTLAWTALKAGRLAQAQTAIGRALRLGTRDPRLFYHAGMIARAAANDAAAGRYLHRALRLSPAFDPLQSARARRTLEDIATATRRTMAAGVVPGDDGRPFREHLTSRGDA